MSENVAQVKRQLGGTQAALNRSKQRVRDLESCVRSMLLVAYWSDMTLGEYQELEGIAGKCGIRIEVG